MRMGGCGRLQRLRGIQRPAQLVVPPVERAVIAAPHLQADAQRLLQPFEPLRQRREQQAQPACFGLVPGRPDAQHGAPAGQHVQCRDLLGQQSRVPVDHRCHDREQLDPAGLGGQPAQRGISLEHLVLRRPEVPDLPHMIHHADPVDAGLLRLRGHLTQPHPQRSRTAVPSEIRDMQAHLHPCTLLTLTRPQAAGLDSSPRGARPSLVNGPASIQGLTTCPRETRQAAPDPPGKPHQERSRGKVPDSVTKRHLGPGKDGAISAVRHGVGSAAGLMCRRAEHGILLGEVQRRRH